MPHAFIPVPNTVSVELIYSYLGVTIENVFHVKKPAPFTLAQIQSLRAAIDTWDSVYWKESRISACTLIRIRTRALDSNSAPMEDYYLPVPRPGAVGGGTALPANVTWCIKLATSLAGRSYRGRLYFPGLSTADIAGNQMNSVYAGFIVARLTQLLHTVTDWDATARLCIASYYNNGAWRTTGVCTEVTTVVPVDLNLDSQRRRLTGRGI